MSKSAILQLLKEIKYAPAEKAIRTLLPHSQQAAWVRRVQDRQRARQPEAHRQLCDILTRHTERRAVIVFNPSLDWERQLFQRPQQLAKALATQGALVFYLQLSPLKSGSILDSIHERLYVSSLPVEQFTFIEPVYVYTLAWNRKYLLKWIQPAVLYDHLDELSAFEGDLTQLHRDHLELLHQAELVTTTALNLYEQAVQIRPDVLLIPNGVEFTHFDPSRQRFDLPEDLISIRNQRKPLIGYYGALANWFDSDLVAGLAAMRQDLNFVLIGPLHGSSYVENGIFDLANIHYLGPKSYTDLPAYLAYFDIAMLPFKVNTVTQSTSPIKLFEYFAGAKPVISTPLREVLQYPAVRIAADSLGFSEKIDEIFALGKDSTLPQELQQIAREHTWQAYAERILQAIEQKASPKNHAKTELVTA